MVEQAQPGERAAGDELLFVAEMDATPGLDATDEEYARMEADRLARKARGIAETRERMERIAALFP